MSIQLRKLGIEEREHFIKANQEAFKVPFVEKFGKTDEEVIPIEHIVQSLDSENAESFNIIYDGIVVGGVVVQIDKKTMHNSLDLLFIEQKYHNLGLGFQVWKAIEKAYPDTIVWETYTPYFDVRNIHFYINKCGFSIVEFFNKKHPEDGSENVTEEELFFRFEKKK